MSLEAALAANTAAVEKLTAILQLQNRAYAADPAIGAGGAGGGAGVLAIVSEAGGVPRRGRPPKQEAAAPIAPAPLIAGQVPINAPVVGAAVVNIKELADRFIKVAETKGEDVARALLKKYGAARLSEVKPELHGQFNVELTVLLRPAQAVAASPAGLL